MTPTEYFIVQGAGQSDYTHHAGSYHMALHKAGISQCNIMVYSSILSPQSIEVPYQVLPVGMELNCIMSKCEGIRGQKLSAGIAYARLRCQDGTLWGGLVVEREGNFDIEDLKEALSDSWWENYNECYTHLEADKLQYITQTFTPDKTYGCALVAMCFIKFIEQ